MGKIVAVITVDDNICGSCPLRECNRCMYFHKQLHKNIEAGYLRCVTCKQAEVREPKAEVKECEWKEKATDIVCSTWFNEGDRSLQAALKAKMIGKIREAK